MQTRRTTFTLATTLVAMLTIGAACSRNDDSSAADESIPPPPTATAPATLAPSTPAPTTAAPSTAVATTAVTTTAAPTTVAPTTVAPTTVVPTTAAPTTVAPTTVPPSEPVDHVVTVHYGHTPIGVWDGSAWQYPDWGPDFLPSLAAPSPALVLTGVDLPEPIAGASLGPLDYFCVGDEQSHSIDLPTGLDTGDARFVAVTADWNVQPRPVQQVGAANPEYAAVGAALVDPASGADPAAGVVRQVVRADLDGNGVEEVLVEYANQTADAPFGTAGDYTLIIARYPSADGTVDDVVLWSYYEKEPVDFPDPADADVLAVADLNGDGVMEVVIAATWWEQSATDVFALVDGRLELVAGGGCGV